jgi:predicted anti-sigma-YlaC factor YlaD
MRSDKGAKKADRADSPPRLGSCAEFRLIVSKAWDSEATAEEVRRLEDHLRGCGRCRAMSKRMRSFFTALDQAVDHVLPDQTPRRP